MTIETIAVLETLVTEKKDRLEAIGRRLAVLRGLVQTATSIETLDAYRQEVDELGFEIKQLTLSIRTMKAEINAFYAPAA